MSKEWTDEEVQGELKKALDIFREDHIVKSLRDLKDALADKTSQGGGNSGDNNNGDEGKPPPVKDVSNEGNKSKKKSLWWGDQES